MAGEFQRLLHGLNGAGNRDLPRRIDVGHKRRMMPGIGLPDDFTDLLFRQADDCGHAKSLRKKAGHHFRPLTDQSQPVGKFQSARDDRG